LSSVETPRVVEKALGTPLHHVDDVEALLEELASARQTVFVQELTLESLYDKVDDLEGRLEASRRTSEGQARLIEALQGELSLWRGGGVRGA
jgi:hypothetical protein